MNSFFLIFTVVIFATGGSAATCNRLFSSVGDTCLRFFPDAAMKWTEAETRCDIIGGHLAQIDNCELLGEISNFIDSRDTTPTTGAYWVGASDVIDEGNFVWVSDLDNRVPSGAPFWGTSNNQREPSGGTSQNCVAIAANDGYHFHDEDCNSVYGVLCEQDGIAAPTDAPSFTPSVYTTSMYNDTYFTDYDSDNRIDSGCPVGYDLVADGCYLALTNTVVDWDGAQVTCVLNGGRLARVEDCDVLGSLALYLQGLLESPLTGYWIGASDENNEGIFQYPDETIAFFSSIFWGQTNGVPEPNGGVLENCVAMVEDDGYYFHDENCEGLHAVLCEAD